MEYIVKFNYGGYWDTYSTEDGSEIRFLDVMHARYVLKEKILLNKWARERWDDIPEIYKWRIVSRSTGEIVDEGKVSSDD